MLSEDVSPFPPPVSLGSGFRICVHEEQGLWEGWTSCQGTATMEESLEENWVCSLALEMGG